MLLRQQTTIGYFISKAILKISIGLREEEGITLFCEQF